MSQRRKQQGKSRQVTAHRHGEAERANIPTAELQAFAEDDAEAQPEEVRYPRATPLAEGEERQRNPDLDPQLVWRGKDQQDWSDLVATAPPLFIQEKVHPRALVADVRKRAQRQRSPEESETPDLFADFNGLDDPEAKTEFYEHAQNWTNRLILGDSLQVMASLAEKEKLRGQAQCIYIDPPYGIKFNSNWQVSTRSRDVKDGKADQISREPEQIKAFRDTWADGIHSYLTYLRDRLTVARDLLADSGSLFVQIGDENVHRVRALMDEVFGPDNFVSQISFQKTGDQPSQYVSNVTDYILWYAKDIASMKFRRILKSKRDTGAAARDYNKVDENGYEYQMTTLTSAKPPGYFGVSFRGHTYYPGQRFWTTGEAGFSRLIKAGRVATSAKNIRYVRYLDDNLYQNYTNIWSDLLGSSEKIYVVQTSPSVVQRCILMTTDPGDLVLDPTMGSATTPHVAEQWGRRWIGIDTSRVALALARARLMGACYPYYLLRDSPEGAHKEAELTGHPPADQKFGHSLRQGFVYKRVPHITLKAIANNSEIDAIWDKWQATLEPLREQLNAALGTAWEEWQIPREAAADWPTEAVEAHRRWWDGRLARQREIDESIARNADQEFLYDQPYTDPNRVRVAGPFTVESLSPHRAVPGDSDALGAELEAAEGTGAGQAGGSDFAATVLDNLRAAGVQQSRKGDRITFTDLGPWPGELIAGAGTFLEGEQERSAAIFIGPEFGTVARTDLMRAAREAREAGFHILIACAFNFDAQAGQVTKLGGLAIVRARLNPDLHMSDELRTTSRANPAVVFGEPDIAVTRTEDGWVQVSLQGLDIFDPQTGEVRADNPEDIAAWFIDTDYDEESFFVRHAYFPGGQDPFKNLRTALKSEIDEEAWQALHRRTSQPFAPPQSGRIAVKVINHFGDEVMQVFGVG